MAISLTTSAADRVRSYLQRRGHGIGLRLGVKKTGCNGFAYVIDYADELAEEDLVFDQHGVKLVVDPDSLALIDGTEVDFVKEGINDPSSSVTRMSKGSAAAAKASAFELKPTNSVHCRRNQAPWQSSELYRSSSRTALRKT